MLSVARDSVERKHYNILYILMTMAYFKTGIEIWKLIKSTSRMFSEGGTRKGEILDNYVGNKGISLTSDYWIHTVQVKSF